METACPQAAVRWGSNTVRGRAGSNDGGVDVVHKRRKRIRRAKAKPPLLELLQYAGLVP